jgi:hypothetical protein
MPGLRGLEPANVISKILLQLARERSQVPKCSGDPRRICPTFQRLSQNDVCEFESSQPRHAVGSPRAEIIGFLIAPLPPTSHRIRRSSVPRRTVLGLSSVGGTSRSSAFAVLRLRNIRDSDRTGGKRRAGAADPIVHSIEDGAKAWFMTVMSPVSRWMVWGRDAPPI